MVLAVLAKVVFVVTRDRHHLVVELVKLGIVTLANVKALVPPAKYVVVEAAKILSPSVQIQSVSDPHPIDVVVRINPVLVALVVPVVVVPVLNQTLVLVLLPVETVRNVKVAVV